MTIQAYAVQDASGKLEPFSYDPGPLAGTDVEIKVTHCGICHSDLSMLRNEWYMTKYPFVPGHEVVGEVVAVGTGARKDNGELIEMAVAPGDKILFGKWSGTEVTVDGEEMLMMKESDIMGIIA